MLLTSFAILSTIGGALWLLGHYFEFHGVAVIGAVLILLVGGAAAMTDVTVRDGEVVDRDYTEFNTSDGNSTVVQNQTEITYQQRPVAVTRSIGSIESYTLGALTMIAGALLLVQDLNKIGG